MTDIASLRPVHEIESAPVVTWGDFAGDLHGSANILGDNAWLSQQLFVGQDAARQQLHDFVVDAPQPVAFVRGRFGTGKTTLIKRVVQDLKEEGHLDFGDVNFEFSNATKESAIKREQPPKLVVVEEVGRNALEGYFADIKQARLSGAVGKLIVNGDDTLQDPGFLDALGVTSDEVVRVDLEPLTPASFKEIIRARLNHVYRTHAINEITGSESGNIPAIIERLQALDGTEKYSPDMIDSIFDDDFLKALIPKTEYPVAEIRGCIALLTSMLSEYDRTQPAHFDGDFYRAYREQSSNSHLDAPGKHALAVIQSLIQQHPSDEVFPAMNIAELIERVDEELFTKRATRIIQSLITYGHIRLFDRSDLADDDTNFQTGRFIPDSRTFLDARFAPIQS